MKDKATLQWVDMGYRSLGYKLPHDFISISIDLITSINSKGGSFDMKDMAEIKAKY